MVSSRSQWPGRFPSGFRKSSICYTTGNGCCVWSLSPRCNSKFHVKSTFSRKPGCVKCNKGHPGSFVIQPTHVVWDRFLASCSVEIREAPFNLSPPLFGHCPNSNYPPPPALKRALWGTFFRRDFTMFYHFYHFLPFLPFFLPFFLWISAPNHPGKGLDPPKIKQMPVWTWKILL